MSISPEILAAYADGELDAAAMREVESELERSPELRAQLAAHRALRAKLAAHFAPISEQAVPQRLTEILAAGTAETNVVDFASEAHKRRAAPSSWRWARFAGPAIAASLILAALGFGLRPSGDYAQGEVADALSNQLVATQPAGAPVRILLSFRDKEGQFCRGFSATSQSGIACRDDRGWRLSKLVDGSAGTTTEYRQAGSADAAVLADIQDMAAGMPLDADDELAALRRGWHR